MKTPFFRIVIFTLLTIRFFGEAVAQCPFDPTVTGNLQVCPDSFTVLGTQQYATYQWFSRNFISGQSMPIAGATGPTLSVEYDQTPVYISVAATLAGCTETSPEVLVDGLIFPPIFVLTEGEFEIGPNGEQVLCAGDTIFEIVMPPYTANVQWYQGQNPIQGANNDTLVVTQPGNYWLTATPEECSNYVAVFDSQFIHVIWSTEPGCSVGVTDPPADFGVSTSPNPAHETLAITAELNDLIQLTLMNTAGVNVRTSSFYQQTNLQVADLPSGVYSLLLLTERQGVVIRKVVVQH